MTDIHNPLYIAYLGDRGKKTVKKQVALDASSEEADYGINPVLHEIDVDAVLVIQEWLETDDLDAEETLADRLFALFVGMIDMNKDSEISDDEQEALVFLLNSAWDYLSSKGVDDDDAGALLNDWDADAASRIHDLLLASMPDGDVAMDADIDSFVWGDNQEPMLDAAFGGMLKKLGGAFKKVFAIRHGKKVRVNKRISGVARLTAKQKVANRKLHSRRISGTSRMRRMKSSRLGRMMGLHD